MDGKGVTTARRISNRVLHVLVRFAPGATTLRPLLHKLRGVKFEGKAFIGDDVYIENEYPQRVVIGDGARITLRTTIIAHMRGPGKVIIGRNVYVGPCSFIGASSGRTVIIGEGSVLAAGSIVTKSVPAYTFVAGVPGKPKARVTVPLITGITPDQFRKGLSPLNGAGAAGRTTGPLCRAKKANCRMQCRKQDRARKRCPEGDIESTPQERYSAPPTALSGTRALDFYTSGSVSGAAVKE